MRPRFTEAESREGLLGGEFGWGFDNCAEWINPSSGHTHGRYGKCPTVDCSVSEPRSC